MKRFADRRKLLTFLVAAVSMMMPYTVKAEEATVTFGSAAYETETAKEFPVGVYIDGDSRVGSYHVEISYDNRRLVYVSGGDSEQDGIITLEGTGSRSEVKYMLYFRAVSGGTAQIGITQAFVENAKEPPEAFNVTLLDEAPIYIEGEDTVVAEEAQQQEEGTEEDSFTDIPLVGETLLEEQKYYIVDMSQYLPDAIDWDYETVPGTYEEQDVTFLTNREKTVRLLYMLDEQENFYLYAYSEEKKMLYPCNPIDVDGSRYYFMSPYVCSVWPPELTLDIIRKESIVYVMDESGHCDFYKLTSSNRFMLWDASEGEASIYQQTIKLTLILIVALLTMSAAVIIAVRLDTKKKKNRRKPEKQEEIQEDFVEDLSLDVTEEEIRRWREEACETAEKGQPVISVQNVTMKFRVAMNNVSGIKEYMIQLMKKQITYREFYALSNVSFNVYMGEVVGIIGTNGSGKSTLLKIVSGALKPTSGKVMVDQSKVQLLTLGTGFDMELTAKENVYLNGAIIGYSKEFIDEKYEEIVQFAELEGFMEEKVKNFSSGMVSRLGFAIATAGETAEILILDEVLSVGDEFFRKKSLKRIQEMIHSGVTVLIVSHSAGTIIENCTKAVWIEKGVLRMVGEPREVCAAYKGMGQ